MSAKAIPTDDEEIEAAVTARLAHRAHRRRRLKRLAPRSLMARAVLIIVAPMILLQVVSTYVFYDRHWESMSRRLAEGLAGDIQATIYLFERHPDRRDETLALANTAMGLQMRFKPGATLGERAGEETGNRVLADLLSDALTYRVRRPFRVYVPVFERFATADVQLAEGVLHIVARRNRLFSSTTYIFTMWMVGTSLVLFAVAIIFMRNQIRPVRRLAEAADAFGKGHDVESFKPEGGTEVRLAGRSFLIMGERIRRQIAQRTEMLAGVSHDLRTPLTRMKLELAMLPDGPAVENLCADVADMERMIGGYLHFARGAGREPPVEVGVLDLLGEVAAAARREGMSVTVDFNVPNDLSLTVRPAALRRALGNLLSNAAPHGAEVRLSASAGATGVEILVDDNGPGIPAERRMEVFRPFHRLDTSRNAQTGGVGLGLTITRDAVRQHGGEIHLEDSPMGGLRARVALPR